LALVATELTVDPLCPSGPGGRASEADAVAPNNTNSSIEKAAPATA
jgi:hypothetical protein